MYHMYVAELLLKAHSNLVGVEKSVECVGPVKLQHRSREDFLPRNLHLVPRFCTESSACQPLNGYPVHRTPPLQPQASPSTHNENRFLWSDCNPAHCFRQKASQPCSDKEVTHSRSALSWLTLTEGPATVHHRRMIASKSNPRLGWTS